MVTPRFLNVATGLGGEVRKKGARDDGFSIKNILFYLQGGDLQNMCPQNKQASITNTNSPHKQGNSRHILI